MTKQQDRVHVRSYTYVNQVELNSATSKLIREPDPEDPLQEYLIDSVQDHIEEHVMKVAQGDYSAIDEFDRSSYALYDIEVYKRPISSCLDKATRIKLYVDTVESLKEQYDRSVERYEAESLKKELDEYTRLYLRFHGLTPQEAARVLSQ